MSLIQSRWLKCFLVFAYFGTAWIAVSAAELRTSSGSRPVSRTVVPAAHTTPVVEEAEFEAGGCAEPCSQCSGGHSCGTQMCQSCCFQSNGMWVNAEFLLAWRHGIRFPPLVTTSPNATLNTVAGVLGQPTTSILYSDEAVGEDGRPGGRISIGTWLDPWQCWGVEARYYMLADENTEFAATSTGDPILARPFFD